MDGSGHNLPVTRDSENRVRDHLREATVRTTCAYCGVGCGISATISGEKVTVTGDESHPANFGRLCSKGASLAETLGMEDRLLYPHADGKQVSWDAAISRIAEGFSRVIREHGPDAVAFYVSGQLLTEDYYVANKLMKGFIGSANIDTNSRLCMASSVAGHKRAFGADIVPGCYEDLELADLIVLTGSNLAWCHPVIYQRIAAAKAERPEMKVVVIDPRRTATCDIADMHLAIAPGGDVPLFSGLFTYLLVNGYIDNEFVEMCTDGADAVGEASSRWTITETANATGLSEAELEEFFQLFAATEKAVTVYSQGVNQSRNGSGKVNAIINCHLLTGRIGKPGMGPFSITGQPNAMGGREVGGLANQLACHMDIENAEHRGLVQHFWQSPAMAQKPGLKAVDLFEAVDRGQVKAVWIMATNPVDSMPNADHVRAALKKCDLVVVSDIIHHTDTAACADILLPATGWGEKDGTVTNSERRISRQRALLPAPGEARHDWQALCDVASAMGWGEHFNYISPADIFREYARLSAFGNFGERDFDLSGLSGLSDEDYDALAPVQWPVRRDQMDGQARFFTDRQFYTQNGRAQFVLPEQDNGIATSDRYPLVLNTGRIRDQWHTMTRSGRTARLSQHIAEPFVEVHPDDAEKARLGDADIALVRSRQGEMHARVLVTPRQRKGSLFAPMHWTERFASKARVDALTSGLVDPVSGQPALKSAAVYIEPFKAAWYGFAAMAVDAFEFGAMPAEAGYWAKARVNDGIRVELAGENDPDDWLDFSRRLFAALGGEMDFIEVTGSEAGPRRLACFRGKVLMGLLYIGSRPVEVSRDWVCEQLKSEPDPAARHRLLAGRPGADAPDRGAIVCSCMNVGVNQIRDAVLGGYKTVAAVGSCTMAGTNCGSCKPEIRTLIEEICDAQTV